MVRLFRRTTQLLADVILLVISYWLAFVVRFDWEPTDFIVRFPMTLPFVVALQYPVLLAFGVHRFAWRYIGLREALRILGALSFTTATLLITRLGAEKLMGRWPIAEDLTIPAGVIVIDFGLSFLSITGIRVIRRLIAERTEGGTHRKPSSTLVPTLLIGAGQSGVLVAREISSRQDLGIIPVGFLDDDPLKVGTVIHGVRVLGTTEKLAEISRKEGAKQALITFSNAPANSIRRVAQLCEDAEIPVKIIPGLYEIVGGTVNLSRMRDVAIEDLLRRDPVVLDETAIARVVKGRVVMVTGAGGSIGSELCRQVMRFSPKRLVLLERAENSLFEIHRELIAKEPDASRLAPCIADISDRDRLANVFSEFRPDVVFHAAAHKHVPMMEWNPGEAIKNNVFGTRILADLADRFQVSAFVMISTDKAVNPTSVMGASKRVAELYIQALSGRSKTQFMTVRFGNVLGSAGSVIPIFKEQIERGGPVTVTHPDMKRFFMTIPEACQLVLQAATMGKGGEIFILDMGEPVFIVDLARDLITLSGLRPDDDIEIQFVGLRPGEKLVEELARDEESIDNTKNAKIFVGRAATRSLDAMNRHLADLERSLGAASAETIRLSIQACLPEYTWDAALDDQADGMSPHVPSVRVGAAQGSPPVRRDERPATIESPSVRFAD